MKVRGSTPDVIFSLKFWLMFPFIQALYWYFIFYYFIHCSSLFVKGLGQARTWISKTWNVLLVLRLISITLGHNLRMFGHNLSQEFKIIAQKVQCHCRSETWYHCGRKSNILFIIEVTLFRKEYYLSLTSILTRSGFKTVAPNSGEMSEASSWPRPRLTATAWTTSRWSSLLSQKMPQVIWNATYTPMYIILNP